MTGDNISTLFDIRNFGRNLREARRKQDRTREQLAELIDVSPRIIYDYEDGFKFPRLETLVRIANAMEVSVDSLLS